MSSEIFCVLRDGAEYSLPKLPGLNWNFEVIHPVDSNNNNNNNNNNTLIHQTQLGYKFVSHVIYMFRPAYSYADIRSYIEYKKDKLLE